MPGVYSVAWKILGRYHMTCRDNTGDTGNLHVMALTTAALRSITLVFYLTDIQWHILSIQTKVIKHVVVNLLHHVWPVGVAAVRTSLMQKDTLDYTHLLGLISHLDDASIGIAAVVPCG